MDNRTMDAGKELANVASFIGDESRASMLWSLVGGESRPASELAIIANVSPQTASNHLKQLVDGGLVDVRRMGRNKFYSLSGPAVAAALESLLAVAHQGRPSPSGVAQHTRPELVFARTCYDHLAGELAVGILKRLQEKDCLLTSSGEFLLTETGSAFFERLGMNVEGLASLRRRFAYPCLDWSHRVPHLGGSLGAALLDWLLRSRIVVRSKSHRAVRVTDKGEEALERLFGIRLTRQRCSLA